MSTLAIKASNFNYKYVSCIDIDGNNGYRVPNRKREILTCPITRVWMMQWQNADSAFRSWSRKSFPLKILVVEPIGILVNNILHQTTSQAKWSAGLTTNHEVKGLIHGNSSITSGLGLEWGPPTQGQLGSYLIEKYSI